MMTVARYWLLVVRLPKHLRKTIPQVGTMQPNNHQPATNNPWRVWASTAALIAVTALFAQTTGKLRLLIDPGSNYHFVLDHQYRMQQREVELSPGPHHFSFWAPERKVTDTTVVVDAGRSKDLILRLPYSPDFVEYHRQLGAYKKDRRNRITIPIAVTAALGIYTGYAFTQHKASHDQLLEDEEAYRTGTSPGILNTLKNETIPDHKADFKSDRTQFIIAGGLFGAAAAYTVYNIITYGKRTPPAYEDKEKIKFDGLVWLPGERGGQIFMGMHIPLR
jgi:hypothetical protein